MSRPRTATALLEARGAFRKDPQRKREAEPVPSNALRDSPPDHLTEAQRAAWNRIVSIAPPGVLWNSDEIMIELASCLLAEFTEDPVAMQTSRIARLERQLAKFGLSPADRAGLEIPSQTDEDDDW